MTDDYDDDLIVDDSQFDEDPVETHEEPEPPEHEETPEEPKAEKKPTRFDKRIGELTWKAKTAEETAQALAEQNEALKQQLLDAQSKLNEASSAQNTEKVKKLRQEKIDALQIEDFDRVSEIDDELLEVKLAERARPVQPAPKPVQQPVQDNRTRAQIDWETRNEAVVKDPQKAEKANKILQRLVQEAGIAPDDPKLWTLLDRNMNRTKPPAPAGNGQSGEASNNSQVAGLTREDLETIKSLGYDPKNPVFQKEFLRAKRAAANG